MTWTSIDCPNPIVEGSGEPLLLMVIPAAELFGVLVLEPQAAAIAAPATATATIVAGRKN